MSALDRWIDRHRRRLALGRFLQRAAEWLAAFLFVFGTAVLTVKLLAPQWWPHVLWLAGGLLPVAGVAWWLSRRSSDTRADAAAWLDRRLGAGGLLMTLAEQPDDRWAERLPQADTLWRDSLPKLRPVRFAQYLAPAVAFAVAACFIPLREAKTAPTIPHTVGQQASEQLEEMLDVLDDAHALDEQEKQQLQQEIEKLAEETQDAPLTHEKWETVDALEERLRMRLDTAAMTVAQARNAIAQLADAGQADAQPLTLEQTEQLEQELTEALQKLAENGALQSASPALSSELQRLAKSGQFQLPKDAAARQQLLDELQKRLDAESRKLSECRGKCQGGQCEGDSLCRSDAWNPNRGRDGDGRPGRGGVSRGRGDAELTWGDEADKQGTKFKEVVLPPGYLDEAKNETVGLTAAAPEVAPADSAPRGTARDTAAASGRETWTRDLRPRHRRVVREYFESK